MDELETIKEMLGLGDGASTADVVSAIDELKKKLADSQKRVSDVEAESAEHKKALDEHKEKAADAFVDRLTKDGKVAHKDEETLKAARAMYLSNPEQTERIYASMTPIVPAEGKETVLAGRVPVGACSNMSLADFYSKENF